MVHNKKLFWRSSIKYRKVQREVIYFPYELKKWKAAVNCHKNCSIHDKKHEISGLYNFWTPVSSNIPDVWNWNCWTLFGSEIEVTRVMAPMPSPQWLSPWRNKIKTKKELLRRANSHHRTFLTIRMLKIQPIWEKIYMTKLKQPPEVFCEKRCS